MFNQELSIKARKEFQKGNMGNNTLNNCPYCGSDNIDVVSGVAYGVKCMACYKVKVQCCDSREEAINIWNKLELNKTPKS